MESDESTCSFLMLSPSHDGSPRAHFSSAMKMQQCVCDVSAQESPSETLHQRFLWEAGHTGTLCLTCVKIPDPKKKVGFQHKPRCLHSPDVVSHPYLLGKVLYQGQELFTS